jgi:RNA polymerase sigma-70 factor (ECF subfamily)
LENRDTTGDPEQKIIEAFIAGDTKAFKYVYNKYRQRVFSYCLYVTGNKTLAEDALQEVFIRIYERREQLRSSYALKNWLLMVTRSVCLNLMRESKFTPVFVDITDDNFENHEPAAERIDHDFPEEIFQLAFRKIPMIYRDAFILREIEGFSNDEVAELTGASATNVKVRVLRAKKMLRQILAPHFKHQLQKFEDNSQASVTRPHSQEEIHVNDIMETIADGQETKDDL